MGGGPLPREVPAARCAVKGGLHPTVPRLQMGKPSGEDAVFLHLILTGMLLAWEVDAWATWVSA